MLQELDCAGGVSLRQLLPPSRIFGAQDIRALSCCGDARRCRPGDVFVAFDDGEQDGHETYAIALEHGASAVIAERVLPVRVPVCVVPNSHEAYGELCQALAGNPADSMTLVGVTGTNGKTTTSMLIAGILKAAKQRTGFLNSIGRSDASETKPASRTTPAPPELATWLARMASNGCSHAVAELSSQGLVQRRTAGLQFDAAVLTNLRRDHIDYHGSVLNYRNAKARLFQQLKPHGFAVINADDQASQFILRKLDCPVITVGQREPAEITATVIEQFKSEQTFLLHAGNESVPVCTQIIGRHHIANCLSAAVVGLVMGIDLMTIVKGLESVGHISGRMERIECGQEFGVFVDMADNPDRLAVALKELRRVTTGRVLCVFGHSESRPVEDRPMLGRVIERAADLGVLTGGHAPPAQPLQQIHDMLDGYDRVARAHVIPGRANAIAWALEQARPGDSVLIAGEGRRGFGREETISGKDDYDLAREWLYQTAQESQVLAFN
ncbi:MAG: UDP-N-acetylmuramoyl-L-alanyl-D-glutamate--2,6-diaminopimelate ligase [Planctomycetaceae bacterium]|nr:UDP-N-acetylmuramoyl-L-alanyl-D-glutamate--2,6-diaminopimelate ligase [Planctomycetaceae bacterium]